MSAPDLTAQSIDAMKEDIGNRLLAEVPRRSDGNYDALAVRDAMITLIESGADVASSFEAWGSRWRLLALVEAAAIFGWWLGR